jgi:ABC-type bacteriocin/lantibiotic exporters, contain an N-terminal double-glycine peptidase domain
VSILGISDAAESIGFRTQGVLINYEQMRDEVSLPCILHWNQNHFVVCYHIKKNKESAIFYISDPAKGKYKIEDKEFERCWASTKNSNKENGIVLLLSPTPYFYNEDEDDDEEKQKRRLSFFSNICFHINRKYSS